MRRRRRIEARARIPSSGISLVGPFRYAIIIWSLLMGFLVWGDVPELIVLVGMGPIAASGLLVLRAEYRGNNLFFRVTPFETGFQESRCEHP